MQNLKNFTRRLFFRVQEQLQSEAFGTWKRLRYHYPSRSLNRKVTVDWYFPPGYFSAQNPTTYPVLLVNDGQDLARMALRQRLASLWAAKEIKPWVIIGIHAGDRLQEYGTIDWPDYKKRGVKANDYATFLQKELFPRIERKLLGTSEERVLAIAGFSLGGLSAFDLAWEQVLPFQKVGVFSGSFWWRHLGFDPKDPDADRIVIDKIATTKALPKLQFWLQTGTLDETSDRNKNGVIDAIDDTLDVIKALKQAGFKDPDLEYVEVAGGQHNPDTWGAIFPEFMRWLERV